MLDCSPRTQSLHPANPATATFGLYRWDSQLVQV